MFAIYDLEENNHGAPFDQLDAWKTEKGLADIVSHFVKDDAIAVQFSLTTFPVLVQLKETNGSLDCVKYAEGAEAILALPTNTINEIKAIHTQMTKPKARRTV